MSSLPLGGSPLPAPSTTHETTSQNAPQSSPNDPIQNAWHDYAQHVNRWFFNPDLQAVEVALAICAAHFHKDCDPVWCHFLGPSGGDKTSIVINSLLSLPQVHMIGELTAKTFLSGYTGTAHPSLLHQVGSGILAFKDFTTFMSKRPEEQAEIAGQLREIYDGSFAKNTGKGIPITWKGKMTVIAAATPALERAWSSRRDLGERFLQVRISRKDGIQQSEYAQRQRGYEEHISTTMRNLALTFFQLSPPITNPPPRLSTSQMSRVAAMSELVAHMRGIVPRHQITNAIVDLPQIENSGRMSKAIASLISNHAALFRRITVEEDDLTIGRRVALNTIPSTRMLIIEGIPISGAVGTDILTLQTGLPESTVGYIIGDLEHLGVVKVQHNEIVSNQISLTPQMAHLWKVAFLPPVQVEPAPLIHQPPVIGAVH